MPLNKLPWEKSELLIIAREHFEEEMPKKAFQITRLQPRDLKNFSSIRDAEKLNRDISDIKVLLPRLIIM